jgi:hypothetical protein
MLRFRNLKDRFGTPASARSFFASAFAAAGSLPKPLMLFRSASDIANGPFGRMRPPTSFTIVVLLSASLPA